MAGANRVQTRTNKTIVKSVKCRIGQLHDTTCLSSTEAAVVCGRAWSGGEGQISLSHVSVEFSGQVRDVSCLGVVSTLGMSGNRSPTGFGIFNDLNECEASWANEAWLGTLSAWEVPPQNCKASWAGATASGMNPAEPFAWFWSFHAEQPKWYKRNLTW
jgi:hypothetical protein